MAMTPDEMKIAAAREAVKLVEPGMRLGLGTGSTAAHFVTLLAERNRKTPLDLLCVPTSEATRMLAQKLGLRLATLEEEPHLDLTVDGADEIDSELRLIKGGGGALLREKIVAAASERMVVIADRSKLVRTLGRFPLPVEITDFGVAATIAMVDEIAAETGHRGTIGLRKGRDGKPFVTDGGHLILDCAFGRIGEPELLAEGLQMIPGVMEHGLFIGFADRAIIAGEGGIEVIEAEGDGGA
jgi:ribose 5-phosphate isomerase A